MLSYLPQKPFLSLSPFLWAVQLYAACPAAAKEEGLLAVQTNQSLFLAKQMLQSCYLNVHRVCFQDWHVPNLLLFQSRRRQIPGVSILWYRRGEQASGEASSPQSLAG